MSSQVLNTVLIIAMATVALHMRAQGKSVFDWVNLDRFDEIDTYLRTVTDETCRSRSKDEMMMPKDVVSQLPVYNQMLSKVWYANRTALIHVHNMALNRAFFYSYIHQKMNDSASFSKQPNWLYFYLSSAADVNANPSMLNGSAMYYDTNCHYPNWYITVSFNRTLPLFAPKAFRWDDYRDPDNNLREPTKTSVFVKDVGSGSFHNYTHPGYKMNTWYQTWLPDVTGDKDSMTKFTYNVGIKRSLKTGQFSTKGYENFAFFGPASPGAQEEDPKMLPVQWTAPYFDCGGSEKWIISAVSPVVDFMPRYSNYTHLRRQRVVGLVVMDIDLNQIDFNSCGVSVGNPGPSYLSGIDRCKKTTSCKHIPGYGFKRGGYKCVCKAGRKYPWNLDPGFMGSDMEQATEAEYKEGFNCEPTNHGLVLPVVDTFREVLPDQTESLLNEGANNIPNNKKYRRKRSHIHYVGERMNVDQANTSSHDHFKDYLEIDRPELAHQKLDTMTSSNFQENHSTRQDFTKAADHLRKANVMYWPTGDVSQKQVPESYSIRNRVDTDIEDLYQEDLKNHRIYQQALLAAAHNNSRVRDALKDSLTKLRDRHIKRFHSNRNVPDSQSRKKRSVFDEDSFNRMKKILSQKASVTSSNCHRLPGQQLQLSGDVGYGVHKQFEPEGRTALRLTQFLSMYLQNAQPGKTFGNVKGGGFLYEDHLFGEVLANVMANFRILSAGIFFDRHKFHRPGDQAKELFGPWAFRKDGAYYAMDTAGLSSEYVNEKWFLKAKSMFEVNFAGLGLFKIRAHVRSTPGGLSSVRFGFYPITYRAANYAQGFWTRPHFRCDGNVNAWVMTYVSPFFGLDSLRTKLEFRGVTTVDVPLDLLQINQCPQPFTVANAFKNTARCDYLSTSCSPIAGFPFSLGSYMCSCRLGFEYWHSDGKEWFEGSFIDLEYKKKEAGVFSRFDHLYCRPSAASFGPSTCLGTLLGLFIIYLL